MTSDQRLCHCCFDQRRNADKTPRALIPIVIEGVEEPYLLCGYCDGDAVIAAKAMETKPAGE